MVRAFTAVDIEDSKILEELCSVRDRLDIGFSPVKPEKMHITLEFFKDIDEEEIEKIRIGMDKISIESFKADIKTVGCFPSLNHIRVVWAGINGERIFELEEEITDNGVISDNNHDFHPHITLMRVKNISNSQKNKLKKSLSEFQKHKFGEININNVKLFKSEFKGGESVYTELYSRDL